MKTWAELQQEVGTWADKNFGKGRPVRWPAMGILEELGELTHAILKWEQGIRGTKEEHIAEEKDAIGNITVFLLDYCYRMDIDVASIMMLSYPKHLQDEFSEEDDLDWICLNNIAGVAMGGDMPSGNIIEAADVPQVFGNLAIYCVRMGWDFQEIIEGVWEQVKTRDWTKNRRTGLTAAASRERTRTGVPPRNSLFSAENGVDKGAYTIPPDTLGTRAEAEKYWADRAQRQIVGLPPSTLPEIEQLVADVDKDLGLTPEEAERERVAKDLEGVDQVELIRVLRGVLEGFQHEAQKALDHKTNKGGQQAGIPGYVMAPVSMLLSIQRDCLHALEYKPKKR